MDIVQGKTEPRCSICKNDTIRQSVDRLAAAGFGATAIADEIMGKDPKLPTRRDSLRKVVERHVKRHLQIRNRSIRQILENRAREQGILLEEYTGQLVSDQAFLDLAIARGVDQISSPNSAIPYKDVMAAIELKFKKEQVQFAEQLEIYERQVWAMTTAVKEMVSTDLLPALVTRARELFDQPDLARKSKRNVDALEIPAIEEGEEDES